MGHCCSRPQTFFSIKGTEERRAQHERLLLRVSPVAKQIDSLVVGFDSATLYCVRRAGEGEETCECALFDRPCQSLSRLPMWNMSFHYATRFYFIFMMTSRCSLLMVMFGLAATAAAAVDHSLPSMTT